MAPLEDRQRLHNRIIAATNNNSASNDPKQHKHDLNNKIIQSAGHFAALAGIGLSEEETLALMSRQLRRQRRFDDTVTMNDIHRQFAQSSKSLADVSNFAEVRGIGLEELPEVDPFGQDQGKYYDYSPDDSQYEQQQLDRFQSEMLEMEDRTDPTRFEPEGRRRYDKRGDVVLKTGVNPQDYEDLQGDAGDIRRKATRESVAPQSSVRDALAQLEGARREQQGFAAMLSGVMGGGREDIPGAAALSGRMEMDLNPQLQREAEAALAYEANNRDLSSMSSRRAAYNNINAQIEAEGIGETMYRPSSVYPGAQLPAVTADQSIAAIAAANPRAFPQAGFNSSGVAFDPSTGNPIGMQGPQMVTANTEPSAALNAPMTTRNWMVEKQPDFREGGRLFGSYPQQDITGATDLFSRRLRQAGIGATTNVRGIDELQRAVDMVIAKGGNFYTKEPVVDALGRTKLKNTRQAQPDVQGVLSGRLRYTPAQETQLANALYQMEVAKQVQINQQGKQQYFTRTGPNGSLRPTEFKQTMGSMVLPNQPDMQTSGGAGVYFNSPEAMAKGTRMENDGAAPVARLRPGQTKDGRDIVTALRGLSNPDARQPFYGAVEEIDSMGRTGVEKNAGPGYLERYNNTGETDPVAIEKALRNKERGFAVNKAKTSGGRIEPIDEKGLRGKVVKAQLTQERFNRDEAKREERRQLLQGYTPVSVRRFRG